MSFLHLFFSSPITAINYVIFDLQSFSLLTFLVTQLNLLEPCHYSFLIGCHSFTFTASRAFDFSLSVLRWTLSSRGHSFTFLCVRFDFLLSVFKKDGLSQVTRRSK